MFTVVFVILPYFYVGWCTTVRLPCVLLFLLFLLISVMRFHARFILFKRVINDSLIIIIIIISVVQGMFDSGYWEVIEETRGGYSRLMVKALRKHDFAWWRCGQKELEGVLAQPSEGSECLEYCWVC